MRKVLDLRASAVIPFDPKLFTAAMTNSLVAASRRGKLADAIGALVLEMSGRPPERRRWWSSAK
jgi:Flp pilus assembly CpaE family ATPase